MPLNAIYQRTLREHSGRWLIHSVCRFCGHEIIANVSDRLHQEETEHADSCTKMHLGTSFTPKGQAQGSDPENQT